MYFYVKKQLLLYCHIRCMCLEYNSKLSLCITLVPQLSCAPSFLNGSASLLLNYVIPQFTSILFYLLNSLQCEVKLAQKRGRLESNLSGGASDDEEGDDGGDSDSDEESSAKARYFGYVKQGLYYVTEMERFAPPRKRPRTVMKNYRLVSLRSTTPEELYQRKVGRKIYK